MSNSVEFVDGDMTEEDRKKIDELLIKIAKEKELAEKIEKLKEENDVFRLYLSEIAVGFANGRNYTREDMIRMAKAALKGGV